MAAPRKEVGSLLSDVVGLHPSYVTQSGIHRLNQRTTISSPMAVPFRSGLHQAQHPLYNAVNDKSARTHVLASGWQVEPFSRLGEMPVLEIKPAGPEHKSDI